MNIKVGTIAALWVSIAKFGAEANRCEIRGREIILWGVTNCRKCGREMLGANWPVAISAPISMVQTEAPKIDIQRAVWNPDMLNEAPEDLCEECYE